MKRMFRLRKFAADRNGATAIEYAILAAGIGLTLAMTVALLGDRMMTTYGKIADAIVIAAEDGDRDTPPKCPPAGKGNNGKGKKYGNDNKKDKPFCKS